MVFISGNEIVTLMRTEWREKFATMNTSQVFEWRRNMIRRIDGDLMPPIATWPSYIRHIFFQTVYPLGDRQMFKLFLFFMGNRLNPLITAKWILSSLALCTWIRGEQILRRPA